jgi:multidrug efflux pump subunit AcrA (membrane-fusion protein)
MSNDENGTLNRPLNAVEFLRLVLGELGAKVGAIWVSGEGQLVPAVAIGVEETGLFEGVEGKKFLQQILTDTLRQARSQTFDTDGLIEPRAFGHATLFLSPLLIPNAKSGVILVVERPNLPQQQRLGVMRHIELRCQELSRQIAMTAVPASQPAFNPQLSSSGPVLMPSTGPALISTATAPVISMMPAINSVNSAETRSSLDSKAVLDYVLSLQRSLDLNEVANVIVNDGRILFGVDRVGLAIRRGRKAVIKAISGQESVHPRGNLIRALQRLTQKVITAGESFRFDGALNAVPKQLEEPLADFIQESGTRFLLIVPLIEPERLVKPEDPMGGGKPRNIERKTIGALIVEQMSSSEPSPQLKGTLDFVTDHIAAATYNSRAHSSIFLLPLWRTLGWFFEWLRGRRLAIALAILVLISAAAAAMVVVPWEYRVDARGLLMPVIQREVFAPEDGQVDTLLVQGDALVNEGDPLIKLTNHELEAKAVEVLAKLQEKKKEVNSLKAQENEAEKSGKPEDKLRAHGKFLETQVEVIGLQSQYDLLQSRLERLIVRAPIKGKVTTFQIEQLLLNRPVKKGEVLLQVMDEDGDWHLELEIAEHRVGRILKARKALSPELPIDYRLLTSPESSYKATLQSLATRTVTAEEKGSVLEARATLDKSNFPKPTIGAEVRARIGCGESFLGDVLFGDVIEFIQKYLWW